MPTQEGSPVQMLSIVLAQLQNSLFSEHLAVIESVSAKKRNSDIIIVTKIRLQSWPCYFVNF